MNYQLMKHQEKETHMVRKRNALEIIRMTNKQKKRTRDVTTEMKQYWKRKT